MTEFKNGIIIKFFKHFTNNYFFLLLTKTNIYQFYAKNVNKIQSKNRYSLLWLNEVNLEHLKVKTNTKFYFLIKANTIKNNTELYYFDSIKILILADFVNLITHEELNNLKINYLNIFNLFKQIFIDIKKPISDINGFYYFYFFQILFNINYIFTINKCAICYKLVEINCLNLIIGGFICKCCSKKNNFKSDNIIFLQLFNQFYNKSLNQIKFNWKLYENFQFYEWLKKKIKLFLNEILQINLNFENNLLLK